MASICDVCWFACTGVVLAWVFVFFLHVLVLERFGGSSVNPPLRGAPGSNTSGREEGRKAGPMIYYLGTKECVGGRKRVAFAAPPSLASVRSARRVLFSGRRWRRGDLVKAVICPPRVTLRYVGRIRACASPGVVPGTC